MFEALGQLEGLSVIDVGAGTGIATRSLLAGGAMVVAVDRGREVLRRAAARTRGLAVVIADGAVLPLRTGCVDLICFAQAWHWLDESTRVAEAHRVVRPGGRWAGWWSHPRADGHPWFDRYWSAIEGRVLVRTAGQRDIDWGATVAAPGRFDVGEHVVVPSIPGDLG